MRNLCPVAAALLIASAALLAPQTSAFAQGDVLAKLTREDFFREGLAPVREPASYDLTIVYFMDYQCPSCRRYTPDVARVLREDKRVRVIYRDTPIFGERSEAAARAAIASQFQSRHEAMHHALMNAPLPLDDAAIRGAANKAGVDWARLQRDLRERADDITSVIDWNQHLSVAAGVSGTPAFIIGNRLADGALEYSDFRASIADARRETGLAEVRAETPHLAGRDEASSVAIPVPDKGRPNVKTPAGPERTSPGSSDETAPPVSDTPARLIWVPLLVLFIGVALLVLRSLRRRVL